MKLTLSFLDYAVHINDYLVILTVFAFAVYIYETYFKHARKLPPGPIGLPIVGYMPFISKEPHKKLFHMRKKYGNILGMHIGRNFVVVLNEYEAMKEVLNHPGSMDREQYLFGSMPIGFLAANGPQWVEERRYCMYAMRNLGFGRGKWESIIEDSVRDFMSEVSPSKGQPVDVTEFLHEAVANDIITLLIGRKYHTVSEKHKIKLFTDFSDVFLNYVRTFRADSVIPGFRKVCEYLRIPGYGRAAKIIASFLHLVKEEMKKHRSLPEYRGVDDFINSYGDRMEHMQAQEKPHFFNDLNLLGDVSILFLASSDTVFSSIGWILRLLAKHQDVQKRVQEELDDVIGRDGSISYDDRYKVPYTFGVIMESQRISSIVPFSTTRIANRDFEVRGYMIPKGTLIMANIWGIHNDPDYFEDPLEFRAERFIINGKNPRFPPSFVPFSVGRRNCPGETMAYMVIFSFVTKLLQQVTITPPPGKEAEFEIDGGLVQYLKPQKLCFIERS